MRALLVALTLTLLALPRAAQADCMGYHEALLTPEVPAGTPLVLLSVQFGELPTDLAAVARAIELTTSNGRRVPVTVRTIHDGVDQTQVEIVPATPLAPGAHRLALRPRVGRDRTVHTLTVVARGARQPLAAATVIASSSQHREYGCGPERGIDVTLARVPTTARFAFVTLVARGGPSQRGFVPVSAQADGTLAMTIGHGMCGGEFMPAPGQTYDATIQLVGADGALGPATTAALTYAE